MPNSEIIFMVEQSPEGGYEARALGHSIYTQAESLDELRAMVRNAVRCHIASGPVNLFARTARIPAGGFQTRPYVDPVATGGDFLTSSQPAEFRVGTMHAILGDVAGYLGVDRESLQRELFRRKQACSHEQRRHRLT